MTGLGNRVGSSSKAPSVQHQVAHAFESSALAGILTAAVIGALAAAIVFLPVRLRIYAGAA